MALRYGCLENELLDFLLDHNITGELPIVPDKKKTKLHKMELAAVGIKIEIIRGILRL